VSREFKNRANIPLISDIFYSIGLPGKPASGTIGGCLPSPKKLI